MITEEKIKAIRDFLNTIMKMTERYINALTELTSKFMAMIESKYERFRDRWDLIKDIS